jgi:hypothetical protein
VVFTNTNLCYKEQMSYTCNHTTFKRRVVHMFLLQIDIYPGDRPSSRSTMTTRWVIPLNSNEETRIPVTS